MILQHQDLIREVLNPNSVALLAKAKIFHVILPSHNIPFVYRRGRHHQYRFITIRIQN